MPLSARWQRGLTMVALAGLVLDALLLATVGLVLERPGFLVGAGAAVLVSVGVWAAWRRQRLRLAAIARERAELVSTIRDLGRDLTEQ